ncbi:MAG: ABC transporter substrate-binding protein [Clostridiales bacterium]|nr:ABC transporter substrate-binding protein [Clostridiales bacterium]
MKKILSILLSCLLIIIPFSACGNKEENKLIRLNEVTHSVFYAPLYVAMEKGYFDEEGIEIELTNGGGADASMTAVLSQTADIGLMGPETVIYVYNQGKSDYPKVFGQLTQKDGAFLVSKTEQPNFKWTDLKGSEILAGRKGGVPAMTFEYILNELGMEDGKDVTLNFDVQFNLITSAFLGGTGDYCTVFEPTASEYQSTGEWYIVASVGEQAGEIPYTSFIALSSYIENNQDTLESFLTAIKKAHEFMSEHTDNEVAEAIVKQFPSTSINSIAASIKSYKSIDAWRTDLQGTEESFTRLQDIMENAGELTQRAPFDKIVDNSLAKKVFG